MKTLATNDLDLHAAQANMHHAAAEGSARKAIDHAIEAGRHLAEAKAMVAHGEWLPWVAANFAGDRSTATRYMRIAANGASVHHLTGIHEALAYLSESSEPPPDDEAPEPSPSPTPAPPGPTSSDSPPSEPEPPTSPAPDPKPSKLQPLMSSDSDEWYTPTHVWRTALAAMRLTTFDLDPCAEPARAVKAARHFTEPDDGLAQDWHGVVWMNPPYGDIGRWVEKLGQECRAGRCVDYCALVPARVDTAWWRALTEGENGTVVFIGGRLKFGDSSNSAPFPSALVFGCTDADDVASVCADLGRAWRPMA